MAERIVIDPITRIEGHLRVEIEVKDGKITDAYSAGTMVRGIETILKGRDPRDAWAFVGRVCGVCTSTHSLTSVRTVENALGISVPPNAELIRNLMANALYIQDHVVHFYVLHALDWVDVVSALKANPADAAQIAQSISPWPKSSVGYFTDIQRKFKNFVDSGQLGIFANGYWGHPAYKLPPAVNLIAVAHYLEALEWQKELVKVHTIFGGKNPHPNYLVGGVPCSINIEEANAVNAERLAMVGKLFEDAKTFVNQVYIPDLLAVASFYKSDWGAIGGGLSNYMSFGDFPTNGYNNPDSFKMPRGVILNRDLSKILEIKADDPEQIQEYINNSWYEYSKGDKAGLHPWEGETNLKYTGPKPPYDQLDVTKKYSWVKTPRWKGYPMEVGPLSRMLVGYASGRPEYKEVIESTLKALDVPVAALFSTLGRTAARGLETKLTCDWALEFYQQLLSNIKNGDTRTQNNDKWPPETWAKSAKGIGMVEAPRGALSHFIVIEDKKIANYQLVVPTTWNASPRDPEGKRSAYEESLIGTPVADPKLPLEVLRTIHSFDPCLACAVHVYDENGTYIHDIKTY
jgi:hydrogenase large subunit